MDAGQHKIDATDGLSGSHPALKLMPCVLATGLDKMRIGEGVGVDRGPGGEATTSPEVARKLFAAVCGREDFEGFRERLAKGSELAHVPGQGVVVVVQNRRFHPDAVLKGSAELFREPVVVTAMELGVLDVRSTPRLLINLGDGMGLVEKTIIWEDSEAACTEAASMFLLAHVGHAGRRRGFGVCGDTGEALITFGEGWCMRAVSVRRLVSGEIERLPVTPDQTWATVFFDDAGLETGTFVVADQGLLEAFEGGRYRGLFFDHGLRQLSLKNCPDRPASEGCALMCTSGLAEGHMLDQDHPPFHLSPGEYSSEWRESPQYVSELDKLMNTPGSVKLDSDRMFVGRVLYMAYMCVFKRSARSTPLTASAAFLFSRLL